MEDIKLGSGHSMKKIQQHHGPENNETRIGNFVTDKWKLPTEKIALEISILPAKMGLFAFFDKSYI